MNREEMEDRTIKFVLQRVYENQKLSTPIYCTEVTSEADALRLSDALPLIYLWNEDLRVGTFSISINGSLLAFLLEALVPRSDESFEVVFDSVVAILSTTARGAVVETCGASSLPPSVLFADGVQ